MLCEGLHVTWRVINRNIVPEHEQSCVCLEVSMAVACLCHVNVHAYSQKVCVINYDTRHTIHVCYQCLQFLNVSIIR